MTIGVTGKPLNCSSSHLPQCPAESTSRVAGSGVFILVYSISALSTLPPSYNIIVSQLISEGPLLPSLPRLRPGHGAGEDHVAP